MACGDRDTGPPRKRIVPGRGLAPSVCVGCLAGVRAGLRARVLSRPFPSGRSVPPARVGARASLRLSRRLLNNNQIKSIPSGAFQDLENLKYL